MGSFPVAWVLPVLVPLQAVFPSNNNTTQGAWELFSVFVSGVGSHSMAVQLSLAGFELSAEITFEALVMRIFVVPIRMPHDIS